jgi:23S rRNA (guanosine2251-2'-O)-methyltransferase
MKSDWKKARGDRQDARHDSRRNERAGPRGQRAFHGERARKPERHRLEERAQGGEARAPRLWIYGRHAALAALVNPERRIKRALVADSARAFVDAAAIPAERRSLVRNANPGEIERALHEGAVHQGVAVEVDGLPRARLREACRPDERKRPVVILDQITDPHNIGAILRSAAAFGAKAAIVQDRRTPPLAGALAKAAAGAVEVVPCVAVVNVARAVEGLKSLGYFCVGLAEEATRKISDIPRDRPLALVLGAEGAGLRRLVAQTCDALARIETDRRMESLNVSNAAAVALYEATR